VLKANEASKAVICPPKVFVESFGKNMSPDFSSWMAIHAWTIDSARNRGTRCGTENGVKLVCPEASSVGVLHSERKESNKYRRWGGTY